MGLIGRNYKHSNVSRRPVLIHRTNTTKPTHHHMCVSPRPLIQYLTHHNTHTPQLVCAPQTLCRWSTAAGKRPDPFRTRKLSPPTPMVLHPEGCGRVGNRRPTTTQTKHPRTRQHTPNPRVLYHLGTIFLLATCYSFGTNEYRPVHGL